MYTATGFQGMQHKPAIIIAQVLLLPITTKSCSASCLSRQSQQSCRLVILLSGGYTSEKQASKQALVRHAPQESLATPNPPNQH